jgi:spore coat polysaccharide biosynthesis protein SpsF
MSMDQATTLVLKCAQLSRGGEVFTLKMPSININDLADIIIENSGKQTEKEIIGLKPGETKFEELMTEHEAQRSLELEDMYIIPSSFEELFETKSFEYPGSIPIKTKIYNSKFQKVSLKEEIRKMLRKEENIVAIIQARMGSTRLPNKTLELIEGKPLLQHVIERIKECKNINKIVIATTKEPNDDQIEIFAKQNNISIFRGNTENVLERYYKAAKEYNASTIVRITADDPFKDPEIIDNIIEQIKKDKTLDYVSNTIKPTFPEGIDTEVLTFKALEKSWKDAHSEFEKEHVTQHIIKNPQKFNIINVLNNEDISKLRWTIDFQEDLDFTREVYKRLYHHNKIFKMRDILQLLEREPYLKEINKNIKQRNWEENV